jgi:transposase
MTHEQAAKAFGVARGTVTKWVKLYREGGEAGLAAKKKGRPRGLRLKGWQAATIVNLITDRCPDQLKLPFALWTRESVGELIDRRFGHKLSVWTIGRYLRRWGFTPQKPARRAFEQDPKAVEYWLKTKYPSIRNRAHREGGEIHWGDEMGLRSDHQAGTCWSPKGKTPVIEGTGRRFKCNVISSITNRGTLRFCVFHGNLTTDVFIDFLRRLVGSCKQKVFLIVDRHPVHRAKKVSDWLEGHKAEIELFFLPAYSSTLSH